MSMKNISQIQQLPFSTPALCHQSLILCTQRLEKCYLRKKKTLQLPQTSSRLLSGAK